MPPKRKKVILIRNAAATDFGGGEKVPVFLAREIFKHGLEPIVFSGSKKLLDFARSENVACQKSWWWSCQNWSGARALLFPVYVVWQIILYCYYLGAFLRLRPVTVHVQSKDDFIAATLAGRTLGINVFWSDYADLKHIWKNHDVWYRNPVGKFVYLAARGAEQIVVVSKRDKQLVAENIPSGHVRDKLVVIYNGAFDTYKPTSKDPVCTFVSTGRLVTDKGIRELILAYEKLRRTYTDIKLSIVGDGPENNDFKMLAKDIEGITFFGHQTNPLSYVARSHVFVLPTYHEGFSLALVEACMEGLAVITTDVGGNPEIIDHMKTGILVKIKNVDELYEAMKLLYEDKELRLSLGKTARQKYVDNFNFEKIIVGKFLPLYNGN